MPVTTERPYSTDRNLFHISFEGGILEDPWTEPPPKMYLLTNSPESAPDVPVYVEIDYEEGNPVAVDGRRLGPVALLEALNRLGGEHGIGRVDLVENRYVGMKSRGVYETPGGTILHAAHRAIESLTLDREVLHLRDSLVPRYAEMIYYGFWFAPEREAAAGTDRPGPARRDGHGPAQALQGHGDGGGPEVAALALSDRLRHLRGGPGLPAAGRRGLHQPQRAPAQDPRAPRPRSVARPAPCACTWP